ncbi:MAG: glycosyltransferase [Nitrososphaerota archaeon]|nr:glycosyltransferase [Nitrososphaerota archaeon]
MRARKIVALSSILAILILFYFFTREAFIFLAYFLTTAYLIWGVYHLAIMIVGVKPPLNPGSSPKSFPKISLIIPARNEPILSRTIEVCLNHVEYPEENKEVIVVTEDPAGERTAIWYSQLYPGRVIPVIRREYFPTKPSALNDSILLCKGDIIGIVDVEDIPDGDTFLKIASAIEDHGLDSVQAILRISNEGDNWITRLFAMEYAGWFRVWLNGRSKLGLFTPLGGTGNYMRRSLIAEVGGWDPLNLAEDAEIAIRFYLSGRRVTLIDARHWEEAPDTFEAWLKQRTRWFRGWIQSLIKYLKVLFRPQVVRRLGPLKTLSILSMLIAPIMVLFNWVAYGMTVYWLLEHFGLVKTALTVDLFPWWAILPLFFNVVYYYAWIAGGVLEKMGSIKGLIKYLPHMIFYMNVMMPLAAFRAFYQEIFKGVFWEKTKHLGKGVRWVVPEKQV